MMDYYDEIANGYDELHQEEQLQKLAAIKVALPKPFTTVLDIGCGTGVSMNHFGNTAGIDPSIKLIEIAKKKGLNAKVADAKSLPFQDDQFDLVTCITAFHHCKDAINEIIRVAKDTVVFSLLKKAHLNECEQIIKNKLVITKRIDEEKDIILICKKIK